MALVVKNPPFSAGDLQMQVRSPGEGLATHSSTLAWRIPWTEEFGRLQSMVLHRAGYNWVTSTFKLSGWTGLSFCTSFSGFLSLFLLSFYKMWLRWWISSLPFSFSILSFKSCLWLHRISVAAHRLSLAAASRDYSLVVVHRLLVAVASLAVEHKTLVLGLSGFSGRGTWA